MSHVETLVGILTGVAIGTALGVLLAPDKGSVTRGKLGRRNEAYADMWENGFNGMVDAWKKKLGSSSEFKGWIKAGPSWREGGSKGTPS